ncbi:MAG: hypothetical protein Aurels2KO_25370 [Aureliella sp.]
MSESKPNTAGDEVVDANVVDAKTEKPKGKSKDANQAKPAKATTEQPSPDKGADASPEVDPPIPATPNYHWPN